MRLFDLLSQGKQCGSISNLGHMASACVGMATGWLLMVTQGTVQS